MLNNQIRVGKEYLAVDVKEKSDGFKVMLTSYEGKKTADGEGATEKEALDAAVAAYKQ